MPALLSAHPRSLLLRSVGSLALVGTLAAPGPAGARRRPAPAPTPTAGPSATQLVQRGVLALAMRDFNAAYAALAEAYRLDPQPDTLYQLGVVRFAEGSTVAAHDLLRRYLADPRSQEPAAAAHRSEAERILARPRPPSGEVRIGTRPGDTVLVDGRLVGTGALPLPLLLTAGVHELGVSRGGVILRATLQLRSGQIFEATQPDSGDALQLRRLAATWIVVEPPGRAAALGAALTRLDPLLERKGLARVDAGSSPPDCAGERGCLLSWAAPGGAEYVLVVRLVPESRRAVAELLDPAVSDVASREELDCDPSDPAAVAAALGSRLPLLLEHGVGRAYATVKVTSQPSGTQVTEDGRSLGFTPLTRRVFAGPHTLALSAPKHRPERRAIELSPEQTQAVHVELGRELGVMTQQVWRRAPRPPLRVGAGVAALVVGLGLSGLGVSALAVQGECASPATAPVLACPQIYRTASTGAALLVPGLLLTLGGVGLIAWPGRRELVDQWLPERPSGTGKATAMRQMLEQ
jgi:hypothetical protein